MYKLYRNPVSRDGVDYEVIDTGLYKDGKVFTHLVSKDQKICKMEYLPIEAVFTFRNPEIVKRIACHTGSVTDEIIIGWTDLYGHQYSRSDVLHAVREGLEAGIFRHELKPLFNGVTLHLNRANRYLFPEWKAV